jgi:hypothetical protein
MRFLLFIALCISPLGLSYVYADGSDKSDNVRTVHTTPHPPHDHHHDDHVKKLDESLKRSREEEKVTEDEEN